MYSGQDDAEQTCEISSELDSIHQLLSFTCFIIDLKLSSQLNIAILFNINTYHMKTKFNNTIIYCIIQSHDIYENLASFGLTQKDNNHFFNYTKTTCHQKIPIYIYIYIVIPKLSAIFGSSKFFIYFSNTVDGLEQTKNHILTPHSTYSSISVYLSLFSHHCCHIIETLLDFPRLDRVLQSPII